MLQLPMRFWHWRTHSPSLAIEEIDAPSEKHFFIDHQASFGLIFAPIGGSMSAQPIEFVRVRFKIGLPSSNSAQSIQQSGESRVRNRVLGTYLLLAGSVIGIGLWRAKPVRGASKPPPNLARALEPAGSRKLPRQSRSLVAAMAARPERPRNYLHLLSHQCAVCNGAPRAATAVQRNGRPREDHDGQRGKARQQLVRDDPVLLRRSSRPRQDRRGARDRSRAERNHPRELRRSPGTSPPHYANGL